MSGSLLTEMEFVAVLAVILLASTTDSYPTDGKFIGLGYNILFGNPEGGDLSHVGLDPGIKSTRHILSTSNQTSGFIVNDGQTSCNPHNATAVFYGGKSYQTYLLGDIVTSGAGDQGIRPYAFTQSTAFKDVAKRTTVNHDVFRDVITVCNTGRTRYKMPTSPNEDQRLSDEFAGAVCSLPTNYSPDVYRQFLDDWGTHVIIGVETGTKVVTRYEQSTQQLADIIMANNHGGLDTDIELESFLGYGSVLHLDTGRIHHSDYANMQGGHVDSTYTIGKDGAPQPIAYTLSTIDRFMQLDFMNNKCRNNLDVIRNNTVVALSEYASSYGISERPTDPNIKIPVTWPHGTYGMYKAVSGCPTIPVGFAEGWRREDAEDSGNTNYWTPTIHLAGTMEHNKPVFYFCIKTRNEDSDYERDWPSGNYCILKKGNCPTGFGSGSIFWDDEDVGNANDHGGVLPDGDYGKNTRIDFCCRNDGFSNKEILLPIDKPFYLMRYNSECQKVYQMTATEEIFSIDTENNFNKDHCSGAHPYDPNCNRNHELHFCYYERTLATTTELNPPIVG